MLAFISTMNPKKMSRVDMVRLALAIAERGAAVFEAWAPGDERMRNAVAWARDWLNNGAVTLDGVTWNTIRVCDAAFEASEDIGKADDGSLSEGYIAACAANVAVFLASACRWEPDEQDVEALDNLVRMALDLDPA